MTFAEKIKSAREARNTTQQELCDQIHVSRRTITAYESGTAFPRASTMRKLAACLGVSIDYLSDDTVSDPAYGLEEQSYIEQVRDLYGNKGAAEMKFLLERNAALFAGGELPQEAKDAFFEAVMKAYITCKEESKKTFGRKHHENG